jgi:hypothetical protein
VALVGGAAASAGATERLTWIPPTDDINGGEISCSDISHVLESGSIRPMLCEHGATVGVLLDLPYDRAKAGALES